MDSDYSAVKGRVEVSKWETFDASKLGIISSRISQPSRIVLNHLKHQGFKSYLVGGCVRDLILNRTPKDFDVITTANLKEVQRQFRKLGRAMIVGRRFPVCLVHVKGSIIEVTSFKTEARTSKGSDQFRQTLLPKFNNNDDFIRCKDSLRRDFTINSLFYEPFANKIYDYANGMADLKSLKLETVIPAQLSFKEDPGRILRGFRIAARLGLSLSREIEAAILTHSLLIKRFDKSKIMIEMNYMLSYGAAEPSLRLLWKFNLLEFLLPVHAAYLDEQANKEDDVASTMLMKLFVHLDNLVGCDRPSDCTLWIGLLAFHLTLVNHPQDALLVWTLASVLYHGEWDEGVKFAKERAEMCIGFFPEIRRSSLCKSDEKIAEEVTNLASLVMNSVSVLVENESLLQSMSKYPSSPRSGMVFVSRKTGRLVSEIFQVLNDVQSYRRKRRSSKINYDMLKKGDLMETRYVFSKIVLDTMTSGIVEEGKDFAVEKCHLETEGTKETGQLRLSDPLNHQSVAKKHKRQVSSPPNPERRQEEIKKPKFVASTRIAEQKKDMGDPELFDEFEYKETSEGRPKQVKLNQKVNPSMTTVSMPRKKKYQRNQLIKDRRKTTTASTSSSPEVRHLKKVEHITHTLWQSAVSKNPQKVASNSDKNIDAKTTNKSDLEKGKSHLSTDEVVKDKERKQPPKSKPGNPPLSSLFK